MWIRVVPFTISFCIGLCMMMLFAPKPRMVVKFPRPDTSEFVYRGSDNECFKIKSRQVSCEPGDGSKTVPQPVHETRYATPRDASPVDPITGFVRSMMPTT
jgi:hypothetical protein